MLRKLLLRKKNITPFLITTVAAALFYRVSAVYDLHTRLSETFFQAALLSLLLGLCCVVRNGGLFKGLSYIGYRKYKKDFKKQKKENAIHTDEQEDNFAQFVTKKYSAKWDGTPYFILGSVYALLFAVFLFTSS